MKNSYMKHGFHYSFNLIQLHFIGLNVFAYSNIVKALYKKHITLTTNCLSV